MLRHKEFSQNETNYKIIIMIILQITYPEEIIEFK